MSLNYEITKINKKRQGLAQLKNVLHNIEDRLRELTVSLDDDVGVLLVRRLPPQPVSCLRLQAGQREDLVALLKNFN